MSIKLNSLFEYQKFEQNPKLFEMIKDTESRFGMEALSNDELDMVTAAGEADSTHGPTKRDRTPVTRVAGITSASAGILLPSRRC